MQRYVLLAMFMVALAVTCGCFGFQMKSQSTQPAAVPSPAETTVTLPPTTVTIVETTVVPTVVQELFPNALKLGGVYNFSSGKTAGEATIYKYWINDTYQQFDPRETFYMTKAPAPGNKYLIIFVNVVNRGESRFFPPRSSGIAVHYSGNVYYMDPTHDLPKTPKNVDSPPEIMRIKEIEWYHKLYGSEYVEDFGYSHGMEQMFLTPGESNALDGYIIYEVPASLTPDKTYVQVTISPQESAVWKLA